METDPIIERIAANLGVADATVRKWRSRGKVPHHMRHRIAEAAADQGYILRTPAFDGFGCVPAPAASGRAA